MTDLQNGKHHSEGMSHLKRCFQEAGSSLKHETQEKFEHMMNEMKHHSHHAKSALDDYVKEHPVKSLGWALLTGAVLGFLLRR